MILTPLLRRRRHQLSRQHLLQPLNQTANPMPITFAPVTDATRNTEQTSAVVNITGIDPGTSLSIAGGEYQLGGSGGFVNTETTIDSGTSVQLRTNASANFSETVTVTLTVGTSNFDFVVTTEDQDVTPAEFSFTAQSDLERNAVVTAAETVTITEVNDTVAVSISGGLYQINDGDFTAEPSTAMINDTVRIQLTTAMEFNAPATASLTIGTLTRDFVTTTELQDLVPEPFSFNPVTEQEPNSENIESNTITLTGINDSFTVTVASGEYKINDGEFTSEGGTASENDQITLRGDASSTTSNTVNILLSLAAEGIEPIESTFSITTLDDVTPPTVDILFPPELSFTNGASTFVRGTAEDDYNEISRITIVVDGVSYQAIDTSGDGEPAFSTWQVEQDITSPNRPVLIEGENTVIAQSEDSSLNIAEQADTVRVVQHPTDFSFPDANVSWGRVSAIELDPENNRLFALTFGGLFAVDLADSTRSLISDDTFEDQNIRLGSTNAQRGILLDSQNQRLISADRTIGDLIPQTSVISIDISSGELLGQKSSLGGAIALLSLSGFIVIRPDRANELLFADGPSITRFQESITTDVYSGEELSGDLTPDENNPFGFIVGIVFDEQNNRLLVSDRDLATIFTVDPTTRERGILSRFNGVADEANDVPNSNGPAFNSPRGIDIDNDRNRLIVSSFDGENIVGVDLENGARTEISGSEVPNNLNNFNNVADVYVDTSKSFFYVVSSSSDNDSTIYAVDHLTGERVIISRASLND